MVALRSRFGPLAYEDPMADLKKLKQTGTLQDYMQAFDRLLDKAQLGEEQALSCFLMGLKHEIEMMVRMFNPKTLQDACSLAKLQDALKNDPIVISQGGGKSMYNKVVDGRVVQNAKVNAPMVNGGNLGINRSQSSTSITKKPLNLTPKQIEERRLKNQCFWCEERFSLRHKCKNRQLYMITVQDDEKVDIEEIIQNEGEIEETSDMVEAKP